MHLKMETTRTRYRRIAHTADLGIFVRGADLDELFSGAAWAVTDVILDAPAVRAVDAREVKVGGSSAEHLLIRWLSELLFLWETKLFVGSRFDVRCDGENALSARIEGETYDAERHEFKTEVKAITFHRLRVQKTARGWRAFFILDL